MTGDKIRRLRRGQRIRFRRGRDWITGYFRGIRGGRVCVARAGRPSRGALPTMSVPFRDVKPWEPKAAVGDGATARSRSGAPATA